MSIEVPEAGLAGLRWMSRTRLNQLHPPLAEDIALARHWGPRFNQHVQYRSGAGRERGQLLAFDPLWNEYAVLAGPISVENARIAVAAVSSPLDHQAHRVDALALYAQLRFAAGGADRFTAVDL